MWALGVTGTYLGDYFGILMDAKVTGFPFNVMDAPMYWGSTMSFLATALWYQKPAGILLTGLVAGVYQIALGFEEYDTQHATTLDHGLTMEQSIHERDLCEARPREEGGQEAVVSEQGSFASVVEKGEPLAGRCRQTGSIKVKRKRALSCVNAEALNDTMHTANPGLRGLPCTFNSRINEFNTSYPIGVFQCIQVMKSQGDAENVVGYH